RLDDLGSNIGFSFAFPLFATRPSGTKITLPISNGGDAQNWIELLNASSSNVTATIRFYSATGELLETLSGLQVPGHGQVHLFASSRLAAGASGSVSISSSRSNALYAQSMFYFYESTARVASMYGSAMIFPQSTPQVGSYNLF